MGEKEPQDTRQSGILEASVMTVFRRDRGNVYHDGDTTCSEIARPFVCEWD